MFVLIVDKLDSFKFSCLVNKRCSLIHIKNEICTLYFMTWQLMNCKAQESAAFIWHITSNVLICQSSPSILNFFFFCQEYTNIKQEISWSIFFLSSSNSVVIVVIAKFATWWCKHRSADFLFFCTSYNSYKVYMFIDLFNIYWLFMLSHVSFYKGEQDSHLVLALREPKV